MKKSIVWVLVVLSLVIGIGLGYTIKSCDSCKKDVPIKENVNEPDNQNYDLSNYVVDAQYEKEVLADEYIRYPGESTSSYVDNSYGIEIKYNNNLQKVSDFKVPYFKFNTDDAKNINKKMEKLYDETINSYNEGVKASKNSDEMNWSQVLTYYSYLYNDLLSVVVINGSQCTSPWEFNFETFVFDVNTGKKLEYNEIIKKIHLNIEDVNIKIEEEMLKLMENLYGQDIVNFFGQKAKDILRDSIKDNTLKIYIDKEGELNCFVLPYCPDVQNGDKSFYNIKIEK